MLSTCLVFEDAVHIYHREGFVDGKADPELNLPVGVAVQPPLASLPRQPIRLPCAPRRAEATA